jgi:NAD(P)H-dependent FMN reductase
MSRTVHFWLFRANNLVINYLAYEWHQKVAGFVSYDSAGGVLAVEWLMQVIGELHVADVYTQLSLFNTTEFMDLTTIKPDENHEKIRNKMPVKVDTWAEALNTLCMKE